MSFINPPDIDISEDGDIPTVPCMYRTPTQFISDTKNYNSGFFSILNINIRSCRRNFTSLISFLSSLFCTFSLIVMTESWLTEDSDCGFDIDGYSQLNLYRSRHGGGLKVYYNSDFLVKVIDDCTFINVFMEILTFMLIGNNFKYIICAIYRPPSRDPIGFMESLFSNILDKLPMNSKIIVIGDLNLNLYNPLRLNYIEDFVNGMLEHSFFPVITKASKINDNDNNDNNLNVVTPFSLLDQIWCNFKSGRDHISNIITLPITDHFPVAYTFNNNMTFNFKKIKYRIFNQLNLNSFVRSINELDFGEMLNLDGPNSYFNHFHTHLFRIYNNSFPIRKKRIKSNSINLPWITPELRRCIKKKYRLYNLYRRGIISKRDFNTFKNTLTWVKIECVTFTSKENSCQMIMLRVLGQILISYLIERTRKI